MVASGKYYFYKNEKDDKVWWLDVYDTVGQFIFSFDKKKKYNLFSDYPEKLSVREWLIFNKENEFWKKFFASANEMYEAEHLEEIYNLRKEMQGHKTDS